MPELRYSPLRHALLAAVAAGEVTWTPWSFTAPRGWLRGGQGVTVEEESTLEHLRGEVMVGLCLLADDSKPVELRAEGSRHLRLWDARYGKVEN